MENMFPLLEVEGSHQDIGRAIGKKFKEEIQSRIALRKKVIPHYDYYLKQTEAYFNVTNKYLPYQLLELVGMSETSGANFKDLFFHNCREVYDFFLTSSEIDDDDRCTTVVTNNSNGLIVGHNEDWVPESINDLYLLSALVDGLKIFGLANNTLLPGDAAMMNNFGLVQCINELHLSNQIGIPKNFIARAVMDCKTVNEAVKLISSLPMASGFNHILAQKHTINNVEIAGSNVDIMATKNSSFVHTNHYLSEKLVGMEKYHTISSECRYQKAKTLLKDQMSVAEMSNLLSDTSNGEQSICNNNTIASIIFLPNNLETWICRGKPSVGEYLHFQI